MSKFFFLNGETGKRYDVVSVDKAAGKVRLRGPLTGKEFEEDLDTEKMARMGYQLMQEQ